MAQTWLKWHDSALSRIRFKLRKPEVSDARRVKIAILDSGIELSANHKAQYDFEPKIVYHSFLDKDSGTEWKDEVGHGTHLAVLLRKIAPDAAIHVARVFRKKPTVANSAESIAAVRRPHTPIHTLMRLGIHVADAIHVLYQHRPCDMPWRLGKSTLLSCPLDLEKRTTRCQRQSMKRLTGMSSCSRRRRMTVKTALTEPPGPHQGRASYVCIPQMAKATRPTSRRVRRTT